jgi:hypothetical protein
MMAVEIMAAEMTTVEMTAAKWWQFNDDSEIMAGEMTALWRQ